MRDLHASTSAVLLPLMLTACTAPPVTFPNGSSSEVPHVTPIPDGYDCGGAVYKVAFEQGVAYVTLPDGTMTVLPRERGAGGPQPESLRLYSNGRVTFSQEVEGNRAVRYAAGRAAFLECKRLP